MECIIAEVLLALAILLLSYLSLRWWKDPLRQIPGPRGWPLLGNALSINLEQMHMQLYRMAEKYGTVHKISIFHMPFVVINSTEACLEALIKRGTDFQGRPFYTRTSMLVPKDIATMSYENPEYLLMRKVATKGIKSYGAGVRQLERIMEQTIREVIDVIHEKDGRTIDTHKLGGGYICSVLASIMFGGKYSYDDPVCQSMKTMNHLIIKAIDPLRIGGLVDLFPFLINFRFLFKSVHEDIEAIIPFAREFLQKHIREAKASFDKKDKRGCIDYFIEAQMQEVDESRNRLLDDECLRGMLQDFVTGGMETSLASLSQVFLDLLHEPSLQKRIQEEIDSQFESTHFITLKDREKLPLLDSYMHENLRYMSVLPFLLPHLTVRDTEVAGYKIPKNTRVLINSFFITHNPEVYDEPFKLKPERFLNEHGKVVEPGHPLRQSSLGFGVGRRICPGEMLARSRIFMLISNLLQKFTIEPVGELPDRDVRKHKMGILLTPPPVDARFIRRQ